MVKIYVEGGGDQNRIKRKCRRGFSKFFEKAGFKGRMPRIVACGSREKAFKDYCIAIKQVKQAKKAFPILLVDAEDLVSDSDKSAWHHLKKSDGWDRPNNAIDDQVHLMVVMMENWFFADGEALKEYFGQYFDINALPVTPIIEKIDKDRVISSLKNATRKTAKGAYDKGAHGFELLEVITPTKVTQASLWAKLLINTLEERLN